MVHILCTQWCNKCVTCLVLKINVGHCLFSFLTPNDEVHKYLVYKLFVEDKLPFPISALFCNVVYFYNALSLLEKSFKSIELWSCHLGLVSATHQRDAGD